MKLGYKPNALLSVFGERITYKGQSIKASVEIGEYDGKGSGFVLGQKTKCISMARNGTLITFPTLTVLCIALKSCIT